MPIVKVKGTNVHVQQFNEGAKETIILLHGMFGNLSLYCFDIAPILSRYYHVVTYDLRGHGNSSQPKEGYGLKSLANDLYHLMEHLEIEKAHLVGYSYGGLVAMKFAASYGHKVGKLAVIDSPDMIDFTESTYKAVYKSEFLEPYMKRYNIGGENRLGKRQLSRSKAFYRFFGL